MLTRNVKKEYENEWTGSIQWIEEKHKQGVTDPAQIIEEYNTYALNRFFTNPNFSVHYLPKDTISPNTTLLVRDGAYVLSAEREYYDRVLTELVDLVTQHADTISDVVELGSGIGRNLFLLARELAKKNISNITFHACEYTDSGRKASTLLSEKHGDSKVKTHYFDYYNPDFSFLVNATGVLFFSVLSIEQIPQVPDKLIDEMIKTKNCYCIQFEPIGWQYDSAARKIRQRRDSLPGQVINILSGVKARSLRYIDKKLGTKLGVGVRGIALNSVELGKSDNVSTNAARWSALQQYNRNYVDVLHKAQSQKKIEITKELVNTMSKNPFNPTTIVSWKSVNSQRPSAAKDSAE